MRQSSRNASQFVWGSSRFWSCATVRNDRRTPIRPTCPRRCARTQTERNQNGRRKDKIFRAHSEEKSLHGFWQILYLPASKITCTSLLGVHGKTRFLGSSLAPNISVWWLAINLDFVSVFIAAWNQGVLIFAKYIVDGGVVLARILSVFIWSIWLEIYIEVTNSYAPLRMLAHHLNPRKMVSNSWLAFWHCFCNFHHH